MAVDQDQAVGGLGSEAASELKLLLDALALDLRLSDDDLGHIFSEPPMRIASWRNKEDYPCSEQDQHQLTEVASQVILIYRQIQSTFRTWEAAQRWLRRQSAYLQGSEPRNSTPLDALRSQRFPRVSGALEAIRSGMLV